MLAIEAPFPPFREADGSALEAGRIWLGTVSANPETSPITVYWDALGTQPAAQPLRTKGGYIVRNGTPAQVFTSANYSITVKNQAGELIYYSADSSVYNSTIQLQQAIADLFVNNDPAKGSALMAFNQQLAYPSQSIGRVLLGVVNVTSFPFLAVHDGTTDDAPAVQAALDYANSMGGYGIFCPPGTYAIKSIRNASVSVSGVGTVAASLRIYANTNLHGPRSAILKNFNDAHFLLGDVADGAIVEGLTIDMQAQAVDDLSSGAVALLTGTTALSVTGSITTGTPTLTLSGTPPNTVANGTAIRVAGAGVAGATLTTTVLSGGGTATITLNTNASTTVAGATITVDQYPFRAYSGYGTESANNIFAKMYQYAGWNFGSSPDGTTRHCIWFTNSLSPKIMGAKVIRSQTSATRFSNNTRGGCSVGNEIYQPRFVGVNISTNTRGCLAQENQIISCLQIGIACFAADATGSDSHSIIGNVMLNSQSAPMGENGIEFAGTAGATPYPIGIAISGNTVIGYGSHGIRVTNCQAAAVVGNHVRSIRLNATQQARYTGSTDGTGIGLRANADYCVASGNTITNVNTYGVYVDERTSKADASNIVTGAGTARFFWTANASSESDATGGVVSGTTLTYPDWTDTIRLTGGGTYSVNSILPAGYEGEIRHIIKRTGAGVVTINSAASALRAGAASQAITNINERMSFKWMNGAWIEWDRNI